MRRFGQWSRCSLSGVLKRAELLKVAVGSEAKLKGEPEILDSHNFWQAEL